MDGSAIQIRNDDLVNLLRPDFQGRNEANFAYKSALSTLMTWKNLRGVWYMGNQDELGNVPDLSGQGRTIYSTSLNMVQSQTQIGFGISDNNGSQYYKRPTEAGLDITGLETNVGASHRGLAFGCWFMPQDSVNGGLVSKYETVAGGRSYQLQTTAGGIFRAQISNTGAAATMSVDSAAFNLNEYYFVCAVFDAGAYLRLYVGDTNGNFTYTEDAVGPDASIFVSTADFEVFSLDAGGLISDGRMGMAWLAGAIAFDYQVRMVWEQSMRAFANL